jgi:hypothetical protein
MGLGVGSREIVTRDVGSGSRVCTFGGTTPVACA